MRRHTCPKDLELWNTYRMACSLQTGREILLDFTLYQKPFFQPAHKKLVATRYMSHHEATMHALAGEAWTAFQLSTFVRAAWPRKKCRSFFNEPNTCCVPPKHLIRKEPIKGGLRPSCVIVQFASNNTNQEVRKKVCRRPDCSTQDSRTIVLLTRSVGNRPKALLGSWREWYA